MKSITLPMCIDNWSHESKIYYGVVASNRFSSLTPFLSFETKVKISAIIALLVCIALVSVLIILKSEKCKKIAMPVALVASGGAGVVFVAFVRKLLYISNDRKKTIGTLLIFNNQPYSGTVTPAPRGKWHCFQEKDGSIIGDLSRKGGGSKPREDGVNACSLIEIDKVWGPLLEVEKSAILQLTAEKRQKIEGLVEARKKEGVLV